MQREEAEHLLFALEMRLGVREQITTGFVEGLAFTNAVEDVEDRFVRRLREHHAVGGAERDTMGTCRVLGACDTCAVLAVLVEVDTDGETMAEAAMELGDR